MTGRLRLYSMFLAVGMTVVLALGGSGGLVVGAPVSARVGPVSRLG